MADLREREAERRDVPPFKVAPNEALLAIAQVRPTTAADVARVRGIGTGTASGRRFAGEVAAAVASASETLPDEERARFERVALPRDVVRARRERESRLVAWRRAEAKRRGVDEQVVLPGHCLKDAVDVEVDGVDALSRVAGIGAFRVQRDGVRASSSAPAWTRVTGGLLVVAGEASGDRAAPSPCSRGSTG